jgi:hypothetical protein
MRRLNPLGRALAGGAAGATVAWRVLEIPPAEGRPWWPVVGTVVVAAVIGWSLSPLRVLLHTPGFVPIALAGWLAAVYGCVPETDQIPPVAAGVAAALVFEVVWGRSLPWLAHLGLATLILWAGLFGASGQGRAVIGTWFGAWGLVLGPAMMFVVPRLRRAPLLLRWVVTGAGGVAALIVARTGALRPPVRGAVRSAMLWATVSASLALALILTVGERAHRMPASRRRR